MRRLFLAFAVALSIPARAGEPPFTVVPNLFDTSRPDDLGLKPVPGTQTFAIFQAGEGTDHYVNGVVLIGFKGKLFAQWQSSVKDEDAPDTHVMYAVSNDGAHWTKPQKIPLVGSGMTTSGGWWTDGKTLVAYINLWDRDIHQGGTTYAMRSKDGVHWTGPEVLFGPGVPAGFIKAKGPKVIPDNLTVRGVIEQDPHALPDGRIVTAFHLRPGLIVAPYFTDDPKGRTGWTRGLMTNLPHQGLESRELEPSWFRRADGCLVMVFRDQDSSFRQLASQSCDRAATWTTPVITPMPDSRQKQSAGNLPDGTAFLVNAPSGNKLRSPLALTLAKDGKRFDRAVLLRAGPPREPRYPGLAKRAGYHYPKGLVWNGALWIGYSDAKEAVVVTRVPLASLR